MSETGPAIDQVEEDSGGAPVFYACLRGEHVIHASVRPIDEIRSTVRLSMMTGYLILNSPSDAMLVGTLLDHTPFHVMTDIDLGLYGRLVVGCDITVRADDKPLVRKRLGELTRIGENLRWFFPLRAPHHLDWRDLNDMEIEWAELPHHDLVNFLDVGLDAPPSERTPVALIRVAQGLCRWPDVLRLLRDHPEELPAKPWAPLKAMAYREMRRWMPAIRAAEKGGIRKGRYPGETWLNPVHLHAMIMAGDEIEALRLLGQPDIDEPDFYDWMRAIALRQVGDMDEAAMAVRQYMHTWPGDVLGYEACRDLFPMEEE